MCSPLTLVGYKKGVKVPIPQVFLNPNNGLTRYSQFYEAVNFITHYEHPVNRVLAKVASDVRKVQELETDARKEKKLGFIARQIELLTSKR
jgi:hypothetical protein